MQTATRRNRPVPRAHPGGAHLSGAHLSGSHLSGSHPDASHSDAPHRDATVPDVALPVGRDLLHAHLIGDVDGPRGDRVAALVGDRAVSYRELAALVGEVSERLGTSRRLVLARCGQDFSSVVAVLAALTGGHAVLLAPADRPDVVASLVSAYDPDVVLCAGAAGSPLPELAERRRGTRHDLHPDLALLLSTSGSTGSPKLVRLSADNVVSNAYAIAEALGINPEDRAATALPLHYCYGLSVLTSHLVRGAAVVLTDASVVEPAFWAAVRRHRVTTFPAVPYTFELLDRVGFAAMELPHLRYVTQAGGRLPPEQVRRWARAGRERGWDLVVMYGQTEATARMAVLPPALAEDAPWSIGRAVPGGRFILEPVDGPDVAAGRRHPDPGSPADPAPAGELVYEGPNVMLGYATAPSDLALGRTVTALRTGDLARQHPGGLVEVVGRLSRFVKIVGLRLDLGRVEALLAEDGLVAAVTGTDDRLVVAVEGDHDGDLLARVLAGTLGLPRHAVEVHPLAALPLLSSGKPDLPAVLALRGAAEEASPPPRAAAAEWDAATGSAPDVRRIYAEQLGLDDVADADTFASLGGDSLSYVATSLRIEDALGDLPADWHLTPAGALQQLARRRTSARSEETRSEGTRSQETRSRARATTAGAALAALPRALRPAPVETGIVLRAVAIVLIVATHAHLTATPGMAHVLMAVAGFNFARFQLSGERRERARRHLLALARIVLPTVAAVAVGLVITDHYAPHNLLLLNAVLGPPTWSTTWHFWFVEMLVYILVGVAALLATPWGDRAARRWPLGLAAGLLALGLLTRFDVVDAGLVHPQPVLWLFALGWAAAVVRSAAERALLTAVALVAVPGFFGDPRRDALILAGVVALVWLPTLRLPRVIHRPVAALAQASLYVYLVHWFVYPHLLAIGPVVAVAGSLAVGIAYGAVVARVGRAVSGGRGRRRPAAPGEPARQSVATAVTPRPLTAPVPTAPAPTAPVPTAPAPTAPATGPRRSAGRRPARTPHHAAAPNSATRSAIET